jgi:cytochrome c oxidase assembly protein subunit 15
MILAMIVLGGVTRLTESGLSIVKWEPILGVLPPMNGTQWSERFEQYRNATGQAAALFPNLTVEQFKPLFLWEYAHRLVGRLTGLVVAIPFVFFLARRRLERSLAINIVIAFVFGGLQGGVGWLMVATGLQKDMTHVSHYALAAHLSLALALMSFIAWLILDLLPRGESRPAPRWLRISSRTFLILLVVQIVYGAFTAGIRAGHFYNTFPTMNGMWLPAEAFGPAPLRDLVANPVAIQWTHRLLAWLMIASAIIIGLSARKTGLTARQRGVLLGVAGLTGVQFALGVATLLLSVPVFLGALHQLSAALLLTAAVALVHAGRPFGFR